MLCYGMLCYTELWEPSHLWNLKIHCWST